MAVFDASQVNLVLSSSAADKIAQKTAEATLDAIMRNGAARQQLLAMLAPGINSMLARKSRNAQTPFGRISGFPR